MAGVVLLVGNGMVRLLNSSGGAEVTMPKIWVIPAPSAGSFTVYAKGVSQGALQLVLEFTPVNPQSSLCRSEEAVTVVKAEVWANARTGVFPHRHVYGVCESARIAWLPATALINVGVIGHGSWTAWNQGEGQIQFPGLEGASSIVLTGGGETFGVPLACIEPTGIIAKDVTPELGVVSENQSGMVGMSFSLALSPTNVCFAGLQVEETPTMQGSHTGYFSSAVWSNCWYHTTATGAGVWSVADDENVYCNDLASMGEVCPPPWSDGSLSWVIPSEWKPPANFQQPQAPKTFFTCNQTFTITYDGAVSVTKHGNTITRMTNDVVILNGVQVQ